MPTYSMTIEAADALIARTGTMFCGRGVYRDDATTVSYSNSASRADIRRFEEVVAEVKRVATPVVTTAVAEEPASERQISYLRTLIADDPGMATNIGASIRPGLTKSQASRFISLMQSGV